MVKFDYRLKKCVKISQLLLEILVQINVYEIVNTLPSKSENSFNFGINSTFWNLGALTIKVENVCRFSLLYYYYIISLGIFYFFRSKK